MADIDIRKLKDSLSGETYKDLRNYLKYHLESLKNIDNIKIFKTATAQHSELIGQKKAYDKLSEILSGIMKLEKQTDSKTSSGKDYVIVE